MHTPSLQHAPVIRVTAEPTQDYTVEIGYKTANEFYSSKRMYGISGNRVLLEADELKTWYRNSIASQSRAARLEKEANIT
jgi:hypothetical protein